MDVPIHSGLMLLNVAQIGGQLCISKTRQIPLTLLDHAMGVFKMGGMVFNKISILHSVVDESYVGKMIVTSL